ncbi:G/U mismatch-specific DNA glycosylase [Saccharopolyspora phatthalungensis]|uniref:TDG/mug DNA glycosylase family protein n=1 Tax=Saccharopolyspora phatthalungensis TaxID=664693 RepID=A0A840QC51_9PSEU|nr:G/U mismatch-specific DNA glycosylase [Saccharopolyspora phatthalungensis]MBB5158314.1 TDG/mug DNA glycosylase family protein [Saccharopolyspora phatthalungensis]
MTGNRPSAQELAAAEGARIPDVLSPGLRVLFCGINPGLWSGATGFHFARPGNRFWPALHAAGFTPRLLHPHEQAELLDFGLGITNVVARASARAAELSDDELRAGGQVLVEKVRRFRPAWVAVVGITAYRVAFGERRATVGPQDRRIEDTKVWVLPNPSGLNAHWTAGTLAAEFGQLRQVTMADGPSKSAFGDRRP